MDDARSPTQNRGQGKAYVTLRNMIPCDTMTQAEDTINSSEPIVELDPNNEDEVPLEEEIEGEDVKDTGKTILFFCLLGCSYRLFRLVVDWSLGVSTGNELRSRMSPSLRFFIFPNQRASFAARFYSGHGRSRYQSIKIKSLWPRPNPLSRS
jgi:hypothetical protein